MFSGGAVIVVKIGHGVDPYLKIPMPRWMKRWQKKWFYLRNDVSTLLLVFTSSRPTPYLPKEMEWLGRTSASCIPCVRPFCSYGRRG
jgi:hypothetical protein